MHKCITGVVALGPGICSPGLNGISPGGVGKGAGPNMEVTMPVHNLSELQFPSHSDKVMGVSLAGKGSGPGTVLAPCPPKQLTPW